MIGDAEPATGSVAGAAAGLGIAGGNGDVVESRRQFGGLEGDDDRRSGGDLLCHESLPFAGGELAPGQFKEVLVEESRGQDGTRFPGFGDVEGEDHVTGLSEGARLLAEEAERGRIADGRGGAAAVAWRAYWLVSPCQPAGEPAYQPLAPAVKPLRIAEVAVGQVELTRRLGCFCICGTNTGGQQGDGQERYKNGNGWR